MKLILLHFRVMFKTLVMKVGQGFVVVAVSSCLPFIRCITVQGLQL